MSKTKKPKKSIYIRASKGKKERHAILSELYLDALSDGFAAYLLENEIVSRYIQELPGLRYSKTTKIHAFVNRKSLDAINEGRE